MIALDVGDKLRGDAAAASVIDYTACGIVSGIITQLADGQLAASETDIYTAASIVAIASIVLVNADTVARTVNLYLKPASGTSRRLIPKDLSLAAGCALLFDGSKLTVLDTSGKVAVSLPQGLSTTDSPTFAGLTLGSLAGYLFGTAGVLSAVSVPQRARMYIAGVQALTPGWTKVLLDTDSFDPDNITSVVNSRIAPTKAGYFLIQGSVTYVFASTIGALFAGIYKNGSIVAQGSAATSTITTCGACVCDLVYLDGVDDYVELFAYVSQSGTLSHVASCTFLSLVGPLL